MRVRGWARDWPTFHDRFSEEPLQRLHREGFSRLTRR